MMALPLVILHLALPRLPLPCATYLIHTFANTASAYEQRSTCIAPWLSPSCSMALKHGPSPSPTTAAYTCSTCAVKGASCECSGNSTSTTKASVNALCNQQHHPSYDNAACDGSDISTACHPPSLYEESLPLIQTFMVGKDQEAAPNPYRLIQSNTTSILLASTPSMLPRWSFTDTSGRSLFADCQRSNPSMAI